MRIVTLFLAVSLLEARVLADCDVGGLQCCVAEFLRLISSENGFDLTNSSINNACMTIEDTFVCMKEYEANCTNNDDRKLLKSIAVAQEVMTDLCSPESELHINIRDKECLKNASDDLKSCISEEDIEGSGDEWTKACCEYYKFNSCAVNTAKQHCNGTEYNLVREVVSSVNGLGYEVECQDIACSSADYVKSTIWASAICMLSCLSFFL